MIFDYAGPCGQGAKRTSKSYEGAAVRRSERRRDEGRVKPKQQPVRLAVTLKRTATSSAAKAAASTGGEAATSTAAAGVDRVGDRSHRGVVDGTAEDIRR